MLDTLDAAAVRRWSRAAVDDLTAHRDEIDALNVFPVADADTGANMLATMGAGDAEIDDTADVASVLEALARGAALGAVGNSGFILSQFLRGLAEAAAQAAVASGRTDGAWLRAGLDLGARHARASVVAPVEGTILSVARAAADAVSNGAPLAEVADAALAGAEAALLRTPAQLAALDGAIDAGGRGLVVVLDALAGVIGERPRAASSAVATPAAIVHPHAATFAYEVQYLLDAADGSAVDVLSAELDRLGDSVAVVPAGERLWKVHAHVDDIGAAVEAGIRAGRPHDITVVRFADQIAESGRAPAVLVVAPGVGLAPLFEREGVHVAGDDSARILDTMRSTQARDFVLLPSSAPATAAAEAAAVTARDDGRRVSVVPTRSPVQVLAAVAVHDAGRRFDDDVVAMAEAAAATRFAELSVARERALTAVGICAPGDVLGLIDGEVVAIGRGLLAVAFTVLDRLLGVGAELITVLVGAEAPHRTGELIEAHVRGRSPFTDVTVYETGQPELPVIIGVE